MANAATLGGHITIGDGAVIGGLVGVHQFVRIGAYAMVGGCSAVSQDVPPFTSVASGNRAELRGLNTVGLRRHGFDAKRVATLKQAYRILFRSRLGLKEAVKKVREDTEPSQDVLLLLGFLETSGRGISR